MAPSEIAWLKPGRLQTLSKAGMEFLERVELSMPMHTVTKGVQPIQKLPSHLLCAATPPAALLPGFKQKQGLEGKVHKGFVLRTDQDMLREWLRGSQTIHGAVLCSVLRLNKAQHR